MRYACAARDGFPRDRRARVRRLSPIGPRKRAPDKEAARKWLISRAARPSYESEDHLGHFGSVG